MGLELRKKEGNIDKSSLLKLSSINALFSELRSGLNLSDEQLFELLKAKKSTLEISTSILSARPLGILESITKYMHENLHLSFAEIALILNRDSRTVWASYSKARKKLAEKFSPDYNVPYIPIEAFQSRKYGTLESVVVHLKNEKGMKFCQIARLLNRDDRTIRTVYLRAMKK